MITGASAGRALRGGPGNDTLSGAGGSDTLLGEAGNDLIKEGTAPSGSDTLSGGPDVDTVDYSGRTAAVLLSSTGAGNTGRPARATRSRPSRR